VHFGWDTVELSVAEFQGQQSLWSFQFEHSHSDTILGDRTVDNCILGYLLVEYFGTDRCC